MKIQPMIRALPTQIEHPRDPYLGPDWASSTLRPGCQDHLLHPSRRGDDRVFPDGHVVTPFPSESKA